jgi:hypothetical protein
MNTGRIVTAEELDPLSPNERAAAVDAHIVTSIEELPERFRIRVLQTGQRLAAEIKAARCISSDLLG